MKVFGILLAAGLSERFESDKLFALYKDKELIRYPIETFLNCDDIDSIVIVCNETNIEKTKEILNSYAIDKKFEFILGGKTRQESEIFALNTLKLMDVNNNDLVADLNLNILKKATKYQKKMIEKRRKNNPYIMGDMEHGGSRDKPKNTD